MTELLKQAKHYLSALRCGICAGLLMLSVSSNADDLSDLRAAVFDYFDGINEVNLTRLHRAFSGTAELKREWKIIDKVFVSSTSPCCEASK